tara:strand:- start:1443 stop:3077 length:1635 start_codon:yes stop_codon:yes gene_type:complete
MTEQQETPQYGFRQTEAGESKGSILWFLLPCMIILRPGKFMLSWGIHAKFRWIILTAWVVGAAQMANWVVNQQRFHHNPLPMKIESWAVLMFVLLGLGLLRAGFEYGLGGLWVWIRLRICGVRDNEWHRSTRIYLFIRLVEAIPALLLLVYFSMRYVGLSEYIDQPVGFGNFIVEVFVFLSPIVSYIAVISCYRLKRFWALSLFLFWPLFWRVLILGGAMIYTNISNPYLGAYPATHHPIQAKNGVLSFEYPNGWLTSFPDSADQQAVIEAEISSQSEQGSLVIRVQPRDEFDLIVYDLTQLESDGYRINSTEPAPNIRVENQHGDGAFYTISKDGKQFKVFHLLVHFDHDHDVLYRMMSSERAYWHAMEGWKLILRTLSIGDLYKVAPDIENQLNISREVFSFQAPGNWHLGEYEDSPFNNLEISAKQFSWFSANIYDRDMSAHEELDMYLNHSIDDILISQNPMDSWLGLNGIGVQGLLHESLAGFQQFKTLYVPLADGRVFSIREIQAQSSADLTDPGFELIESTFKLLVEPASAGSTVDP